MKVVGKGENSRAKATLRLAGACFWLAAPLRAEVFDVTNLSDTGAGSLRAAIAAANVTSEPDVIVFSDENGGGIDFHDGLSR